MTTEIIKAKYSHDVFVPEKKPIVQEGQIVELKITSDVSVVQNFYGCLALEDQDLIEEIISSDDIY